MKLSGAIPAAVMPMRDDQSVDEVAYEAHIDQLAGVGGVGGVVCNGHAAEVTALTGTERRRSVAIAASATAGRVPVVAGVAAQTPDHAAALAREAAAAGADGLLVFPAPVLALGGSQQMGYQHVAAAAAAVDLPIVLFCYPASTAMAYTEDTLAGLCRLDAVCAVKEWSLSIATAERTRQILDAADHHVALLTSFSTHLLPALTLGADGILSGHGSVVADLHADLFTSTQAGDLNAATDTYRRLQVLTRVVYAAPMAQMYARMKEHMVMLGRLESAAVRPPLHPVGDDERQRLRDALTDAGRREGAR